MKTNRNKWLMATASSSTHLGDVIFEYAIKWWIASISTSATFLAVVLSIETLVSSLFNMVGGVFADRYNRRKLLIGTDIISGIGALALFFFAEGKLGLILLLVVNTILAVTYSIYAPTSKAIVVQLFDKKEIPSVNALFNGLGEVVKIAGPAIGVLLIGVGGIQLAFLINAVSFFLSAALQSFFSIKETPIEENEEFVKKATFEGAIKEFKQELLEGWGYVRREKKIFAILLLASGANFFIAGYLLLLPFVAKQYGHYENLYGWLLTAQAIGGILGATLCQRLKIGLSARSIGNYLIVPAIGILLTFLIVTLHLNPLIMLMGTAFYGIGLALFNVQFVSYIQQHTALEYIGRVFSIIFTIAILFIPVGNFVFDALYTLIENSIFLIISLGILGTVLIYRHVAMKEETLEEQLEIGS